MDGSDILQDTVGDQTLAPVCNYPSETGSATSTTLDAGATEPSVTVSNKIIGKFAPLCNQWGNAKKTCNDCFQQTPPLTLLKIRANVIASTIHHASTLSEIVHLLIIQSLL